MSTVRRAEVLIVLSAVRDVEGFELELAARTLAAGWGGDVRQLLEATAGIVALREGADGVDPVTLAGRFPQLGYLLAVERALAERGVGVLCREVEQPPLDLRGQLVIDLARAVGAHPMARGFVVEWSSGRGWSTVIDTLPQEDRGTAQRCWHWFDGVLPEPEEVAERIVRHLDGDLAVPGREAWRYSGRQLLDGLGAYPVTAGVDGVPTVCRSDAEWRLEHFGRRLLWYEPPPLPRVGDELQVPGVPGERRTVVAVLPQRAGDEDLYWVRLAGHDFPISWDAVWQYVTD
ncbi:hypothetical protein GCM10009827_090620 [Dactylosporangium maewongense]|uniref:DUF6292 domain-containing protein n=1 Tax=Dactylosporangium maewongense TaxID=634393 RepID=A0ABN2CAT1_9ACTN